MCMAPPPLTPCMTLPAIVRHPACFATWCHGECMTPLSEFMAKEPLPSPPFTAAMNPGRVYLNVHTRLSIPRLFLCLSVCPFFTIRVGLYPFIPTGLLPGIYLSISLFCPPFLPSLYLYLSIIAFPLSFPFRQPSFPSPPPFHLFPFLPSFLSLSSLTPPSSLSSSPLPPSLPYFLSPLLPLPPPSHLFPFLPFFLSPLPSSSIPTPPPPPSPRTDERQVGQASETQTQHAKVRNGFLI